MNVNNALLSGLTRAANHFVTKMQQRIAQNGLPDAISESIEIEPAEMIGEGTARIRIKVGGDKAPMAAAYEYGSGLHRMEGQPAKYPIYPKTKKALAFEWGEAKNIMPERLTSMNFDTNRVVLPYVMHPGVKPRQYITPTLIAEQEEIERIITGKVLASIKIGERIKATMR